MSRAASLAEQYRAHREEFLLALELGCTPAEARAELARRAARERWQEAKRRLDAKMRPAAPGVAMCGAVEEPRGQWWKEG